MKSRVFVLLLAMCMTLAALSGFALAVEEPEDTAGTPTALADDEVLSGTCGDGVTWRFDPERNDYGYIISGTLTISGNGAMYDYEYRNYAPWSNYQRRITQVFIEDGVTSIGSYAFYDCENLTSIAIANSVTSIGEGAFYSCKKLTSVHLPSGIKTIETDLFNQCSSLTHIEIPDSVLVINRAFGGCSSLTSISIPASVIRLDDHFGGCSSLTNISVAPANREYASQDGALFNKEMNELIRCLETKTSFTIPSGVTKINTYAFVGCSKLTEITIPFGVESIGDSAFAGCSSLSKIILPEGITSIGYYAFKDCTALIEIEIPAIRNASRYNGLSNTFTGCTALTKATISEGYTELVKTFKDCSNLTTVYIPASVKTINFDTFANCVNLENIIYAGTEEQWSQINIGSGNTEMSLATITYLGSTTPVDPDPTPTPTPTPDPDPTPTPTPTPDPTPTEPGRLPTTVANGGLGRKVTVTVDAGHWLTVQVHRAGSIAITSVQAPGSSGKVQMVFSASRGSTVKVWETEAEMSFNSDGVPVNPILSTNAATL